MATKRAELPLGLYNLTRSVYEEAGFTYERPKGKGNCVMTATIAPNSSSAEEEL